MIKNVIPFFLDGGIQEENTNATWNGTSSFVSVATSTGTREITLGSTDSYGRPIKHGVMVTVVKSDTGGGQVKVVMDPDFSSDGDLDEVFLYRVGQSAVFLFKDSNVQGRTGEWVVLSHSAIPDNIATNASAALKAGINTFTQRNTFNGDVTLGDSNSDRIAVKGKLIKGNITVTDVDAQDHTLTAAEFLTGVIIHTSVTGAGSITFDTAANLISTLELEADNEVATCLYINDGDQNVTLNGGTPTGVTYVNNPTIAAEGSATLVVRRTGSAAVQVIIA